jgi:hypothetical protein
VIIINKSDIVEKTQDLERVKEFVSSNAGKLLGIVPNIFIVSAKEGLRIKAETKSSSPQMKEIQSFILTTLDTRNRFKLKLLNPLGILDNLTRKYAKLNAEQKEMIREDIGLLDDINRQISLFGKIPCDLSNSATPKSIMPCSNTKNAVLNFSIALSG